MIIKKELKNATFEYDEEKKTFLVTGKDGESIELNKVYAFAFMRFVVRMAQRNWLRTKKSVDKIVEDVIEPEHVDHPDQMKIFE
jgi:hypothetical protein|tara:strand:+ start:36268 stop:36519 length:252 start_codon:yes stop_codon:yes gene_type:complete